MTLDPTVSEWLNLFTRWFHVFAGILWIGTTYFFTWLDGRFSEAESKGGKAAEVWMVHSGGFYVVEKQKRPGPHELHWFKWEAALTWLSGVLLLTLVYYLGGVLVDRDVMDISQSAGIGIGVGSIVLSWIVYELIANSPLVKKQMLFAIVSFVLIVAVAYGLSRALSGRAMYIHVGAIFGTIMAANVWMRILPAQRKMIAATSEGRPVDETLGARAKLRSKHNTFMVVPLVFTMISNHFPAATYGDRYNWARLAGLILLGWIAAKILRRA